MSNSTSVTTNHVESPSGNTTMSADKKSVPTGQKKTGNIFDPITQRFKHKSQPLKPTSCPTSPSSLGSNPALSRTSTAPSPLLLTRNTSQDSLDSPSGLLPKTLRKLRLSKTTASSLQGEFSRQAMQSMPELHDTFGAGESIHCSVHGFLSPQLSESRSTRKHTRRWSAFGRASSDEELRIGHKRSGSGFSNNSDSLDWESSPLFSRNCECLHDSVSSNKPQDFAIFLCLRDKETLGKIQPYEFADCTWSKPESKHSQSKNIMAAIEEGNVLYKLVTSEILRFVTAEDRAKAIDWFIKVCASLYERNNYNSLKMVLCGLQCQAVHRLRKTWAIMKESQVRKFKSLQALMAEERGYFAYREQIAKANFPKIPYLGVYLTDLTMLYEAKRNNKQERAAAMGKTIQEFCDMVAESHYKLEVKSNFSPYLAEVANWTDEELYKRSQELEPGKQISKKSTEASNQATQAP